MTNQTRRGLLAASGAAMALSSATRANAGDPSPPRTDPGALPAADRRVDFSRTIASLKREIPLKMRARGVRGLAIGLVRGDDLIWADGFGFTDRSMREPVTPDTLFSLQSMSKGYTAVGVLRAAGQGWLGLDDPLVRHLPSFTVRSRFGPQEVGKITVRHLLSHFAGLCHEAPLGGNYDDRPCAFAEHVASISDTWLMHPVGSAYSYSNLGFDLAGFLLEQRSGLSFERCMKEMVLDPIGMRASTFDQPQVLARNDVARGEMGDFEVPRLQIPMRAAGGLYSSARDMAKFVSFQLARGKVGGDEVLSPAQVDEMRRPQFPVPGQVGGYGLGLITLAGAGAQIILHSGGGYGYSSDHRWIPDYGLGVVVACNQETGNAAPAISNMALRLMATELLGALPVTRATAPIREPSLALDPAELRKLAGTYRRRGSLATLTERDGNLVLGDSTYLDAHADGTFTNASQRYFVLTTGAGAVRGLHVVGPNFAENASEFWPLNDTPGDPPGPNRTDWTAFVAKYAGRETARPMTLEVLVRNGHLYVDSPAGSNWHGGVKLTEYRPGLFFTADGEAVQFTAGRMALGNRPFLKQG